MLRSEFSRGWDKLLQICISPASSGGAYFLKGIGALAEVEGITDLRTVMNYQPVPRHSESAADLRALMPHPLHRELEAGLKLDRNLLGCNLLDEAIPHSLGILRPPILAVPGDLGSDSLGEGGHAFRRHPVLGDSPLGDHIGQVLSLGEEGEPRKGLLDVPRLPRGNPAHNHPPLAELLTLQEIFVEASLLRPEFNGALIHDEEVALKLLGGSDGPGGDFLLIVQPDGGHGRLLLGQDLLVGILQEGLNLIFPQLLEEASELLGAECLGSLLQYLPQLPTVLARVELLREIA